MKYEKFNYININPTELDQIFNSAKNGDAKSFETLSGYVRHISYSYFQSKLRKGKIINEEDVDDLSNNVYLSFAEQYHKIEKLEFWLRRVLFLTYINFYKKAHTFTHFSLEETEYIEDKRNDPGDNIDAQKILEMVNELSEDKQQILKLRFWEDLKFNEIAEKLNKSEDAVKKMFYRSIEELKKRI